MQRNETKKREQAALLVAEDKLTDEDISELIGINRVTLHRWKLDADFKARVASIVEEFRQKILTGGIADRLNRVNALNDRWQRMQQVITERAIDPQMGGIPGGRSGLLVHQVKGIGKGEDFQVVDQYAVDAALLAELRAHEQQAAKELGQWIEKQDVEVRDSSIAESVERKLAGLAARLGASGISGDSHPSGEGGA